MAECLLELSFCPYEVIYCLRLGKFSLSEGKLSVIKLDESAASHPV